MADGYVVIAVNYLNGSAIHATGRWSYGAMTVCGQLDATPGTGAYEAVASNGYGFVALTSNGAIPPGVLVISERRLSTGKAAARESQNYEIATIR
jgi:hypothetical protein